MKELRNCIIMVGMVILLLAILAYTGMNSEAVSCTRDKHGSDGGGGCTDHEIDGGSFVMVPNLVASFVFKPELTMPKPPELREAGMAYHESLLHVLGALHKLTAASLGVPSDFFAAPREPTTVLRRLSYYPPLLPENQLSSAIWYGEHTDYTWCTILHKDESNVGDINDGGLQVKLPNGNWYTVPSSPGAFVVDIGELYEVWTNGRFRDCCRESNKPCDILLRARIFCFQRNNQHEAEPLRRRDEQ